MPRRACRRLARLAAHVASSTEAGVATALPDTTTTDRSAELHAESAKYLPLGVSSQFRRDVTEVPRFYERAEGHYHYDVDGNKLLDYGLAFGPLILGSNHPAINAAVTEKVTQLYGIGAGHEDEVKLARLMTEVLGTGVDNVLFSNTGTEAVQTAIKLARATTGRSKIVKFEGHYHGWANNVLVSVHQPPEDMGEATGVMPTLPEAGGNPDSEHSEILTLPWNRLDLLEELLASRGDEIAAVICEPINGNSGCLMPAEGFLAGMVELCAKFGAKSIFDEVITGFRIALGGAREFFGVIPDLSTHAKAMAGGFAMSAVAGKKEMFDCLRDVRPLPLSPPLHLRLTDRSVCDACAGHHLACGDLQRASRQHRRGAGHPGDPVRGRHLRPRPGPRRGPARGDRQLGESSRPRCLHDGCRHDVQRAPRACRAADALPGDGGGGRGALRKVPRRHVRYESLPYPQPHDLGLDNLDLNP